MNTSEVVASNFWLLDFDRTLGDTQRLYQLLLQVGAEFGIDSAELDATRQRVEAAGGSFDAILELTRLQPSLNQSQLLASYRRAALGSQRSFLLPGATTLLERLAAANQPWAILTYGGSAWQRTKLAAAGLADAPALIIDRPDKGRLIATWLRADGNYHLPPELAGGREQVYRRVILIDDRLASFAGLPQAAVGIHLTSSSSGLAAPILSVGSLDQIDVASFV